MLESKQRLLSTHTIIGSGKSQGCEKQGEAAGGVARSRAGGGGVARSGCEELQTVKYIAASVQ